MTQTSNRFFDEIGRLMNDAAGAAQGVKREVDTVVRNQAEKILRDLDIVKREEFEAVKDMARLAREENEALKARIAARLHSTASLQGCGGCGRGGVLAPKGGNDKEMRGFFYGFGGASRPPRAAAGHAYGVPSLASSTAIRAFRASFSSRASRAMSLTASNSSRLTMSRSRRIFSA